MPAKEIQERFQRVVNWLNLYPECANAEFGNKLLSNSVNFLLRARSLDPLKRAGCSLDRDVVPEDKTGKDLDFKPDRMEGMSSSRGASPTLACSRRREGARSATGGTSGA